MSYALPIQELGEGVAGVHRVYLADTIYDERSHEAMGTGVNGIFAAMVEVTRSYLDLSIEDLWHGAEEGPADSARWRVHIWRNEEIERAAIMNGRSIEQINKSLAKNPDDHKKHVRLGARLQEIARENKAFEIQGRRNVIMACALVPDTIVVPDDNVPDDERWGELLEPGDEPNAFNVFYRFLDKIPDHALMLIPAAIHF